VETSWLVGNICAERGVEYKEEAVTVDKPKENKFLDSLQLGLDIAGFIPVAGEIADAANGLIYLEA